MTVNSIPLGSHVGTAPMRRDPTRLADETFDLLVIGGGILGAGIARDATLRGLRVALVEQADFGSGTSSRSTKLIHGGFRYLEQWQFRLVAEACRERQILLRMAPHLVRSLPFLLPVYDGDPRPLWKIRAGMTLYDWMSRAGRSTRHCALTPEESLTAEPLLDAHGLRGAVRFFDAQMDDARLCLETLVDAAERGARCVNYCEAIGFETLHDRVTRVWVRDAFTEHRIGVSAKVVINAAGPWVERVAGLLTTGPSPVQLSTTKGAHLVLPRLLREHGIYFQSRRDDRMIFLLPFGAYSLLGTTDTECRDFANPAATRDDVQYLLDRLREVAPACRVAESDIITTFAGVRPLLRADRSAPSHRPREHRLAQLGPNFLAIAGGKYTTFRAIADQVTRAVFRLLGIRPPRCLTDQIPLALRPLPTGDFSSALRTIAEYACRNEMAQTVSDVMRRRTRLALSPLGGEPTAETISHAMARELSWDETTRASRLREYVREWECSLHGGA